MIHDVICPAPEEKCLCVYIARARVDEREAIAQSIDDFTAVFGSISTPLLNVVADMARNGRRKYGS